MQADLYWAYFEHNDRRQQLERLARNGDLLAQSILDESRQSEQDKLQVGCCAARPC